MDTRGAESRGTLLGLPIAAPAWSALWALVLLACYGLSMSRSLSLYDSPELALVAAQFGLGHPFGQPLHSMLGGLLARIPGLDPLLAINGLSALAGAATLVPVTSLSEAWIGHADVRALRWVPPSLAALGLYLPLWEPATRIEVYSLATFFGLWATARLIHAWLDRETRPVPFFLAGLALGLSASANPVCAAVVAAAVAPALLFGAARGRIKLWALGITALGASLGLLCYLYVLAVATREDVLVWGAPRDSQSLWHYFSAADFAEKQVQTLGEWGAQVTSLMVWSVHTGLALLLPVGLLGYLSFTSRPALGLGVWLISLTLVVAFISHNGVFAPDVLDYLGYLAIPTWLAASGACAWVVRLASRGTLYAALALVALASFAMLWPPTVFGRTRHRDRVTQDLAQEALNRAPHDALLLVEHDHWVGPLLYLQEQERVRPDVTVLAYGLASSSWYWEHVYRRHPGLEPFELRGPGGRSARVRRFIDANATRPVQVEHIGLAAPLGLGVCPSAWMLDVSESCSPEANLLELPIWLASQVAALHQGSPGTDSMVALVAFRRGHDLWLLGLPRAAIAALLSASPDALEQTRSLDLTRVPTRQAPRPSVPAPQYEPQVALGHPARNLHYASKMARQTGATELADALQALCDELGPVREISP